MNTASRTGSLHLVASLDPEPARFTVVTQAMVGGAQETAARVLTPIGGSSGPQIAVRVGRIMVLVSDRQALDPLFRIVKKKHWIVPGRQEELKILAVETIGLLGGESSREFLEKVATRSGRIGRACSAALETMGQRTASSHE